MGRQPRAEERLPSQRARPTSEMRELIQTNIVQKERIEQLEKELKDVMDKRNSEKKKAEDLLKEWQPVLDGRKSSIPKLRVSSQNFYHHADERHRWIRRYDVEDVAPLVGCALKRVDKHWDVENKASTLWRTLMGDYMKQARETLLVMARALRSSGLFTTRS